MIWTVPRNGEGNSSGARAVVCAAACHRPWSAAWIRPPEFPSSPAPRYKELKKLLKPLAEGSAEPGGKDGGQPEASLTQAAEQDFFERLQGQLRRVDRCVRACACNPRRTAEVLSCTPSEHPRPAVSLMPEQRRSSLGTSAPSLATADFACPFSLARASRRPGCEEGGCGGRLHGKGHSGCCRLVLDVIV